MYGEPCLSERMNHHVPGIAVSALSPAIISLSNRMRIGQNELNSSVETNKHEFPIHAGRFVYSGCEIEWNLKNFWQFFYQRFWRVWATKNPHCSQASIRKHANGKHLAIHQMERGQLELPN